MQLFIQLGRSTLCFSLAAALAFCGFSAKASAGATSVPQQARTETDRWEKEIHAFEEQDRKSPPPSDAVLFIGSSSIRMWKTLTEDFAEIPVINRGFGGSEMADSTRYVDRIVWPHHPRLIVVYAGTNDISNGKSPTQVRDDYREFVARVRERLPEVPVVFLAIKPTAARVKEREKEKEANRLIAELSRNTPGLLYVDTERVLVDRDGRPNEALLATDKLHFNAEGYRVWTAYLRPRILKLYRDAISGHHESRALWIDP